ncbi:unnamed protein product, partial [Laminaria digitata]
AAPASLASTGDRLKSARNSGDSGGGARRQQQPDEVAGSPVGAMSLRDRRAVEGGRARGGSSSTEPLRRSASSPPSMGCSKGSPSASAQRPHRQNTPPPGDP